MFSIISISDIFLNDYLKNKIQYEIENFECPFNKDPETFLKNAIESAKHFSVISYLIISDRTFEIFGYFTLALKILSFTENSMSKNRQKNYQMF